MNADGAPSEHEESKIFIKENLNTRANCVKNVQKEENKIIMKQNLNKMIMIGQPHL